jgi:excinuclease ABC subunit C
MIKSQYQKKYHLPDKPGVYLFKRNKDILYIGKATSLRDRVKSYFSPDLISMRGPLLVDMVFKADKVDYIETDSVLEALILEANLIKKHQPRYNTLEKDDKSFDYIIFTKEDFPRVLITRGREIEKGLPYDYSEKFGPFTNSAQLKSAVKIIRKIFPFRDKCSLDQKRPCFNCQIGLCPGACTGLISKKDYQKNIKNIRHIFEGKKKLILKNLEKEMKSFAKLGEYEKAGLVRNKIFALNHIHDVSLLKSENFIKDTSQPIPNFRIEAYDAAHLSGTNNVGVMVVWEGGELKKADYRKFIIRNSKGDDIGALRELLSRRLKHAEWPKPNLIVLDGGKAQLNIARKIITEKYQGERLILLAAVTKDDRHKAKTLIGTDNSITRYKNEILLANSEAHRFALAFHRVRRARATY